MMRYEVINWLIKKHGYKRYLEIGLDNPANCFNRIEVETKCSVDPFKGATYRMTSDAFFAKDRGTYDIVFLDGLHESEQAARDIENSIDILRPNGSIVVHDCDPDHEAGAQKERNGVARWYGDVYLAWIKYRSTRPDLSMVCLDLDCGLGIIRRGEQNCYGYTITGWRDFKEDRVHALNLVKWDDYVSD